MRKSESEPGSDKEAVGAREVTSLGGWGGAAGWGRRSYCGWAGLRKDGGASTSEGTVDTNTIF